MKFSFYASLIYEFILYFPFTELVFIKKLIFQILMGKRYLASSEKWIE
jgi:hypothetical protein